jgi:hypothetical protein
MRFRLARCILRKLLQVLNVTCIVDVVDATNPHSLRAALLTEVTSVWETVERSGCQENGELRHGQCHWHASCAKGHKG